MNTRTINSAKPSLAWRFAWKEYRMLRALWLAGFVIAIAIQSIPTLLQVQKTGFLFFPIAWGAAAVYAVGAAIIMFAAETDDRTREYLRLLPGDWKPIFFTKTLVSFVTAILLGCVLSLIGRWFAGKWLSPSETGQLFGVFGVAVLEFLAWGLLFSMWWKHPLLASVAAIACASLSAQLAIGVTEQARDSFSLEAYQHAVPARLLICVAVFAADVLLGRRWLYPRAKPVRDRSVVAVATKVSRPRLRMFSRLVWQTWRESWRMILVAVPLAFGLMAAALLPAFVRDVDEFLKWLPLVALIPPALLGALVFRADQQRDHRLFLATHAAWPRYVWLARHVVWLGVVVVLGLSIHSVSEFAFERIVGTEVSHVLSGGGGYRNFDVLGAYDHQLASPKVLGWELERAQVRFGTGLLTGWCAWITAYGIGQLCSLLKQSLLSGFLAILLSIVLAAWSVLMFVWQLEPLWYVLPMGLSAFLATLLRAPNWILQKNKLRHWLIPAAVATLPLVAAVAYVPSTRMAQIDELAIPGYQFLREPLEVSVAAFRNRGRAQEETLLELYQVGIVGPPRIEEISVDGKRIDEFDLSDRALEFYGTENAKSLDPADTEILDRFKQESRRLFLESNQQKIPALLAVINDQKFVLHLRYYDNYEIHDMARTCSLLLSDDARRLTKEGKLEDAWLRLKALTPLMSDWPYFVDYDYLTDILAWAKHPDQTSARLKDAIIDLQKAFARLPHPRDNVLAAHEHVRQVLLGDRPPRYANPKQIYFFLNRLPGEQDRALRALDLLVTQYLNYADAVVELTSNNYQRFRFHGRLDNPRELLRAPAWTSITVVDELVFDGVDFSLANRLAEECGTSFLAARELDDAYDLELTVYRWIESETKLRALLVQLALIAYQHDHGTYPESLAELAPDYLPEPVADPFSGRVFEYRPQGLPYKLFGSTENGERVEFTAPGTPLLWSVGYCNMHLEEVDPAPLRLQEFGVDAYRYPQVARMFISSERYCAFTCTERGAGNRFVFSLPKLETAETDDDGTEPLPKIEPEESQNDNGDP